MSGLKIIPNQQDIREINIYLSVEKVRRVWAGLHAGETKFVRISGNVTPEDVIETIDLNRTSIRHAPGGVMVNRI